MRQLSLYFLAVFTAFLLHSTSFAITNLSAATSPFAVDLHLHGHSNHNAGSQPASMEYHSIEAILTGYADVLWWTDHTRLFDQWRPFSFSTALSSIDDSSLSILNLASSGTSTATNLEATISGGSPLVSIESGTAIIKLQSDPDASTFQYLSYDLKNSATRFGTVTGFGFNRPLTSEPIANVQLVCESAIADAVCEIEFGLAWHHNDNIPVQQTITYRIDPEATQRQASLISPWNALIVIPPETTDSYSFDLLRDSLLLENGDDNTVNSFILRVGARYGALGSARFRGLILTSQKPSTLNQIEAIQNLAKRYESQFELSEPVGLEFGTEEGHLNGFLPRSMDDRDTDLFDLVQGVRIGLRISDWADKIHLKEGIISLNHPFGPGTECGSIPPDECLLNRAQKILDERAYNADLLEVGYIDRGLPLQYHLDLWDILTANELFLYGTGVSDNHGVPWEKLKTFVTWVASPSSNTGDLLSSLKAGKFFFGNPKTWKGNFSFQIGTATMGDRLPTPGGNRVLTYQLEPWPDSVTVYLVQGLIKPGLDIEYLKNRTPLVRGQDTYIDTSQPCFVRLEAYEELGDGTKIAIFTNPIVLLANPGSASGKVFNDINGDAQYTADEPPINNARLILRFSGQNGSFDPDGDDIFTNLLSDVSGNFFIPNLTPGAYRLSIVRNEYSIIPPDAELTTGISTFNFNVGFGDNILNLDFGYRLKQDIVGSSEPDSNGDGLTDTDAINLNLDPNAPDGDTDGDGISDLAEIGGLVSAPLDADLDGIIDALEPGASAEDNGIAENLALTDGSTLTIIAPTGETLSEVEVTDTIDLESEISSLFGSINYSVSSPAGGTITVRLIFSDELPDSLALYKEDNSGQLTRLSDNIWTRENKTTVAINLTDGEKITDLDASINGVIEDPIVFSTTSASTSQNTSEGSSGSGCTLRHSMPCKDIGFLLLLAGLFLRWVNKVHSRVEDVYVQDPDQ